MILRLAQNDKIVTRYMDDQTFQNAAFSPLARAIFRVGECCKAWGHANAAPSAHLDWTALKAVHARLSTSGTVLYVFG